MAEHIRPLLDDPSGVKIYLYTNPINTELRRSSKGPNSTNYKQKTPPEF
jgi:hypothetical protein